MIVKVFTIYPFLDLTIKEKQKLQKSLVCKLTQIKLFNLFGLSQPELDLLLIESDDLDRDEVGLGRIDWSHLDELLIFDDFELFPTKIWSNLMNNLNKFTLELNFVQFYNTIIFLDHFNNVKTVHRFVWRAGCLLAW